MAIEAVHDELNKKVDNAPSIKKVLHDYPILIRRIQSWQESVDDLLLDPTLTKAEQKELSYLQSHVDAQLLLKERSDKPPKAERSDIK